MDTENFKAKFESGQLIDLKENKEFRILDQNENAYKVQFGSKIYNIVVDDFCANSKSYHLIINDVPVKLNLQSKLDQLIEKMGLNKLSTDNLSQLKAPMPGLVLKTHVTVGDAVSEGDALITLEAMKMENIIKAKGSGVVKSVVVATQDKVEKSQLLIEFE